MMSTNLQRLLSLAIAAVAVAHPAAQQTETPAATKAKATQDPAVLPDGAPAALGLIDEAGLMAHAMWLADDARGGRLTGSPGQEAAARYIADHFKSLGLEPMGDEDPETGQRSYFQRYPLERTSLSPQSSVTVGGGTWIDGFAVLASDAVELEAKGKFHFLGFGRTRGSSADVPADFDFDGVLPVIVPQSPRGAVTGRLGIEQKFMMSFTALQRMSRNVQGLAGRGAKVVVVALPADPLGFMDVLNTMTVAPGKDLMAPGPWKRGVDQSAMLVRMLSGGPNGVPVVFIGPKRAAEMAKAMGAGDDGFGEFVRSGGGEVPETTPVDGQVALAISVDKEASASNVVAVLQGSDEKLREQAVVYSAHMDHVGLRLDGDVFNGADDNASGSAGLMEIAQAYAGLDERPRRSVIFLSVSGEELGLWGSEYYAKFSTWPLDNIVADINTDMIGRTGPESGDNEVTVTPSYRHPHFSTMVQEAARVAEKFGMSFESGDKYYERSDHFNFAKEGIPVVFFCNGEHEDYHQVSDHPEKLNGAKMERIARIAFWTGWNVANADDRPEKLGRSQDWR